MKDELLKLVAMFEKKTGRFDYNDKRKIVDCYFCEYINKDGIPFRKSFMSKVGIIPNIPESGLNSVLNKLKYQY